MKRKQKAKKPALSKRTERPADVMSRLVAFLGQDKTYRLHLLKSHWKDIVGEVAADHVRPVRMDFKKLFLAADAPVWSNELRYMERKLIDKINAFVCDEFVTEISFCSPRSEYFSVKMEEKEEPEEKKILPDREDIETSEAVVEGMNIENEELKTAATRAFAQNLALRRVRAEENWKPCASCGRMIPPAERLCLSCDRKKREEESRAVRNLLLKEPWLHVYEVAALLNCSRSLVIKERSRLLRDLASRVKQRDESGEDAKKLVMLFASVKPEELNDEIMKKYLNRLRFDLSAEAEEFGKKRKGRGKSGFGWEE